MLCRWWCRAGGTEVLVTAHVDAVVVWYDVKKMMRSGDGAPFGFLVDKKRSNEKL